MTRYLILGNGAAGATAAEEIRARDPKGSITMVSPEPYPMYSRPGLAYVLLNDVPEQQIIARQPEWYAAQRINVVYTGATRLEPAAAQVLLANGQRLSYDKLLIATGARAVPLPYPGSDLDGVVYLDTLDDTKKLMARMKNGRRAVVIGGGITALELADGLAHHRLETNYLVRKQALWSAVFNEAESKLLEERMKHHRVKIHFNSEIAEILGDKNGRVKGVRLTNGKSLACDILGAGIGVKPVLDFARGAGLKTDKAILVNEFLETSLANIYAAGDCAQNYDRWTERYTHDVLWPTAIAGGRIAGANMTGQRQEYIKGTPFNACLLFGMHITAIGQLGGTREEAEPEIFQHISRGSSEIWSSPPRGYASAWADNGPSTLRLSLSDDVLVGALVIGQQTLADPLRELIEKQVNMRALHPYLEKGGPPMVQAILKIWANYRRGQVLGGASRQPAGLLTSVGGL
jgi:nitrite reductase (NADH) large subunit